MEATSIDHCLIPEGNVGWMLDSLRDEGLFTPEWQAMEGKIFDNLAQTGACGCAAVPLFLDHAWKNGLIKPGERVLLIGVEATKWIYARPRARLDGRGGRRLHSGGRRGGRRLSRPQCPARDRKTRSTT